MFITLDARLSELESHIFENNLSTSQTLVVGMGQGITLVCCTPSVPHLAAHLLKKKMVIGGFILGNMKLETIVDCIPVARATETEANLDLNSYQM